MCWSHDFFCFRFWPQSWGARANGTQACRRGIFCVRLFFELLFTISAYAKFLVNPGPFTQECTTSLAAPFIHIGRGSREGVGSVLEYIHVYSLATRSQARKFRNSDATQQHSSVGPSRYTGMGILQNTTPAPIPQASRTVAEISKQKIKNLNSFLAFIIFIQFTEKSCAKMYK